MKGGRQPFRHLIPAIAVGIALSGLPAFSSEDFVPPVESTDGYRHFLYSIPAPRGLIVDREGKPMAQTVARRRLALNLKQIAGAPGGIDDEESIAGKVLEMVTELRLLGASVHQIDPGEVCRHWENRPFFPMAISGFIATDEMAALEGMAEGTMPGLSFQDVYERIYPAGKYHSHLVGYAGGASPEQHGPLSYLEPLWQEPVGIRGLEKSFDDVLRGKSGLMSVVYTLYGEEVFRQIVKPPRPGQTVVTTLHMEMQKSAVDLLEKSGRNGAFVVLDSETGDILAAASNPSFDPNEFAGGISAGRLAEIQGDRNAPLFNRAFSGMYPPGSTFKPIVALGGLFSRKITSNTKFSGPPSLNVAGKVFRNWNSSHEGTLDVRYALTRSCNTWFYQAAMETGGTPILNTARLMGFGEAPPIRIDGVSAGFLPEKVVAQRALANLSIGQGEVLASPLQVAAAMTAFANDGAFAVPRLVIQTQDSHSHSPLSVRKAELKKLGIEKFHFRTVTEGLWGVVNHAKGTAPVARHDRLTVYGKTGTSQWRNHGEEHLLAWFCGFVGAENPRLAFAVLMEGRAGEGISGGKVAAPIADRFINDVYRQPEKFAVVVPRNPEKMYPNIGESYPIQKQIEYPPRRGFSNPWSRWRYSFGRR